MEGVWDGDCQQTGRGELSGENSEPVLWSMAGRLLLGHDRTILPYGIDSREK